MQSTLANPCCEMPECGSNSNLQVHHLFSQTKRNKKLYGELIHSMLNTMIVCGDCHLNKPIPKLTEVEFCKRLGIEPRSKEGKEIWKRMA